eukprot:847787-Pyramimonas_sp.AAC.1
MYSTPFCQNEAEQAQEDLKRVRRKLRQVSKRRVTPKWSAPIELWDMALNPGGGIPAKKQVEG